MIEKGNLSLPTKINPFFLGITTEELDSLLAETAAYLNMLHPDFGRLAARVAVTSLHKKTKAKAKRQTNNEERERPHIYDVGTISKLKPP